MLRLAIIVALLLPLHVYSQGQFLFANPTAPTHVGSATGPLAGTNIWAHMLAGLAADSLAPVGPDRAHRGAGIVAGGVITVDGVPVTGLVYIQMLAWDGALWGTNLATVPEAQLGRTDVVLHTLGGDYDFPAIRPPFTQPAIVPIPEPSILALMILAGAFVSGVAIRRSRRPPPPSSWIVA